MAYGLAVSPPGGSRTWTVVDADYRTVGPIEEWQEAVFAVPVAGRLLRGTPRGHRRAGCWPIWTPGRRRGRRRWCGCAAAGAGTGLRCRCRSRSRPSWTAAPSSTRRPASGRGAAGRSDPRGNGGRRRGHPPLGGRQHDNRRAPCARRARPAPIACRHPQPAARPRGASAGRAGACRACARTRRPVGLDTTSSARAEPGGADAARDPAS
jgi:hypothetical protein